MQPHPASRQSRPALPTNKVLLLGSDCTGVQAFQLKFARRFPSFSVITHLPASCMDGGLDAMIVLFESKQAELLVICKPEASQAEIRRARELAGDNGVDVYEVFLSDNDFFVRATSQEFGDRFLWFSEKETRTCDFQTLKSRMIKAFAKLDEQ
jgi:hypothetical protein